MFCTSKTWLALRSIGPDNSITAHPPRSVMQKSLSRRAPRDSSRVLPLDRRVLLSAVLAAVAREGLEEDWYEAIVVEVNGDMLTVRWRDYPREHRFVRHRFRVGLFLFYSGSQPASHTSKRAKPSYGHP
jgi:hypothetical protein